MSNTSLISETLRALALADTPTIANAMEKIGIAPRRFTGPEIRPFSRMEKPVVGIAITGTMQQQWGGKFDHLEPWLEFLGELEAASTPAVAILQDCSANPYRDAMIGEGMALSMRAAGAAAILCDGAIRDLNGVRETGLPVWARGASADRGSIRFHRYQVPVCVGGMAVNPGDIIHADENGALIVPQDRLDEIVKAAAEVTGGEAGMFEMLAAPDFRVARLYERYAEALRIAREERERR
jgi:4-hydroxy-4-methyl-2-oxoglutarate aldolase